MQWIHCILLIQRNVRIKQLQEFVKSDHLLQRYCVLSGGIFYFEPPCRRWIVEAITDCCTWAWQAIELVNYDNGLLCFSMLGVWLWCVTIQTQVFWKSVFKFSVKHQKGANLPSPIDVHPQKSHQQAPWPPDQRRCWISRITIKYSHKINRQCVQNKPIITPLNLQM